MTARFLVPGAAALALAMVFPAGLGRAATTSSTDVVLDAPLSVLEKPANQDRLGRDITFHFADAPGGTPIEGRIRSRKHVTNSFKGVEADCEAALVSTLETIAISARQRGGTRVVNLRSFWAGYPTSSATTYKCGRGRVATSVSLVGTLEGSN
ncbi:hypothetical protein [Caulobacter sp. NIBR1757]|uniref:hypothetical protein n=1 Tax=Caulobacter sp. NIBR1757 TaxID=3016000 RepID=UPI0022F0B59E|nr:hypothetical protein [Caulobacter sp. NIBR1757]WGM40538.1 hypothetical protein AMEJIAPC_03483 [Caulobacter sp. NIBR1757]